MIMEEGEEMVKNLIRHRQTGSRIIVFLSALLIAVLLFTAPPFSVPAKALRTVVYKVEVTSDSIAAGWNKATLKIGFKTADRSHLLDIKDELAQGKTMSWTFEMTDEVPSYLQLYLDFGGGLTVRSHSGRIKLFADGEELLNEPYSARSYPFVSSNETLDFIVRGIAETELVEPNGTSTVYPTFNHSWKAAKEQDGCTVKLNEDVSVDGTLEVTGNITIDLNGHFMSNAQTNALFIVRSGGMLKLRDSDPERDTGEDFFVSMGMTSENDTEDRIFRLTGGGIFHGGSEESGGAVIVENGGELNVEGCTFTDIHSQENGGAVYCEGKVSFNGTKFIYCTALKGDGGVICAVERYDVSFENVSFVRCSAENGGAICLDNSNEQGATRLENCSFDRCLAEKNGGAYYHIGRSHVAVSGLSFRKCHAKNGGGMYLGGAEKVYNDKTSSHHISDSTYEDCSASGNGGGICYENAKELNLDHVEFSGCSCGGDGGAVYLLREWGAYGIGRDIRLSNCEIHHCSAEDDGGAVYIKDGNGLQQPSKTVLYKTALHDNSADTGGGLYVESYFVYLISSSVTYNKAKGKYGGGVYVDSQACIELAEEIVIRDNTAKNGTNNLCLQNGVASTAYAYCGGLYDGSHIGISSTGSGSVTAVKNISQYQAGKYIHADDYQRKLSMTNKKEVKTPLFASLIADEASWIIIIAGAAIIAAVIVVLFFYKRRKGAGKP